MCLQLWSTMLLDWVLGVLGHRLLLHYMRCRGTVLNWSTVVRRHLVTVLFPQNQEESMMMFGL